MTYNSTPKQEYLQIETSVISPLRINMPNIAGQIIEHHLEEGQQAIFNFDAALATHRIDGNNLVLEFGQSGSEIVDRQVVLLDLIKQAHSGNSPILVINDVEVSANQLIAHTLAFSSEQETLETAAGSSTNLNSGGGSRYNDDFGDIIDLLDAQDVILPTELEFILIEPTPDIIPFEEIVSPDEPEPPYTTGTPPLADGLPDSSGGDSGDVGGPSTESVGILDISVNSIDVFLNNPVNPVIVD